MASSTVFDVIVVGAGVEGSATAYQLIKSGAKRVLLLEQFSPLHSRGSSHGSSRITRRAYTKPYYIQMVDDSYSMWEEVERESGMQLFVRTGFLMFGPKGSKDLEEMITSLSEHSKQHQVFSAAEANRRYPHQLKLPLHYQCVLDEDGGILLASKCLAAFQNLFMKYGGVLKDYHKVTEIIPGERVTVKTNHGDFAAKRVIITAGPWTPKIMRQLGVELPVVVTRAEILYWRAKNPEHFSAGSFPMFKEVKTKDEKNIQQFYNGIPILEYPGLLKVAKHAGPVVDPDHRDSVPFPHTIESVSKFIERCLKGVATTPSICEPCLYAESPDEDPIIDKHPSFTNISFATGFSGHGFQKAPSFAKILMELALGSPPSYDIVHFRLDRFNKPTSKL